MTNVKISTRVILAVGLAMLGQYLTMAQAEILLQHLSLYLGAQSHNLHLLCSLLLSFLVLVHSSTEQPLLSMDWSPQ